MRRNLLAGALALVAWAGLASPRARAEDAPPIEDLLARARSSRAKAAEVVGELLARPDARGRAWGAYLAAEHRVVEAQARLAEIARDPSAQSQRGDWLLSLAVLDALLRLEARVDPSVVMSWATSRSTLFASAALVLLLRTEDDAACLEAFRALDEDEKSFEEGWAALGNALAARKARGFAARAIGSLTLRLSVSVTDGDTVVGGGTSFGSGHGDGRLPDAEGYPPLFLWKLTFRPSSGDTLVAPGPRPVHLHREPARRGFGSWSHWPQPRDSDRLAWLGSLLGEAPERLPAKERAYAHVDWSGAEAFVKEAVAARQGVLDGYWALARRLVDARLATAAEARALVPRVEVEVHDTREDKSVPVPDLPAPNLACPWPEDAPPPAK